jgi:signal transduction histidine kinase
VRLISVRVGEGRVHLGMYARVGRQTDAPMAPARYREVVTADPGTENRLQAFGERLRARNPWVVDGTMAAVFVFVGLITTASRGQISKDVYEPQDAFGVFLVLMATVPFVFRRRAPLTVLLVSTTAVVLESMLGHNEGALPFFLWVAVVTVAALCPTWKVLVAAGWIFAGLFALVVADGSPLSASGFALNCALFAAMFMFGFSLKSRKERIDALEERAAALERETEEESRRAVADERLHIARELHDVVAHSMGVIAVQASMGEHVIDSDPDQAKQALHAISDVSRSTLTEIRRMLGVLRDSSGDDGPAYAPAPGLGELGRLTRELAGAGLPVEVAYEGSRVEVPRGVDLTAYRIVQEALTNVLKHAGPAHARVVVRYEPGALGLEIFDDGRGVNGRSNSSRVGHGLVGMRERVAVYGGTLEAAARGGGGFRVAVTLPYGDDS